MRKYFLFILAFALILGACNGASADEKNGERLFKKYCVKCHGEDGSVSEYGRNIKPRPARDLRTNRLFIAPAELRVIIKYGVYGREMKGWENMLTNDEILDVAGYARTLKYTPDAGAGEKFFKVKCAGCHAPEGAAKKLFRAPDLDMSPLGAIEMARVIRFGRHGTMMGPKLELFTNPEIANVVEYLQSIKK
ncbi:MAG: c-type cytochrome [Deltaproteobacteria bacterium]|nr:c-type cytochrome [Deltaproteobacteria bacterium]